MELLLTNLALAVVFFGSWMLVDYLYVRRGLDLGGLAFFPLPAIAIWANLAMLEGPKTRRWCLALVLALAHVTVLFIAIITIGLDFHFSIGGSM